MPNYHIEIPVDSIESALAAQEGGANRIELCANLEAGGTTPSAGMIALAKKVLHVKLHVMIRPRAGDFVYSDKELEVMKRDIIVAKQFGADGVVFGILTKDNGVDLVRTKELVRLARPLQVTFHRAFDLVAEPFIALENLTALGIERILTSGQKETAIEGISLIKQLVDISNDRISMMPASGITHENIQTMIRETRVHEFHIGTSVTNTIEYPESKMFNSRRKIVSSEKVRRMKNIVNELQVP